MGIFGVVWILLHLPCLLEFNLGLFFLCENCVEFKLRCAPQFKIKCQLVLLGVNSNQTIRINFKPRSNLRLKPVTLVPTCDTYPSPNPDRVQSSPNPGSLALYAGQKAKHILPPACELGTRAAHASPRWRATTTASFLFLYFSKTFFTEIYF